ncbi:hypothetical protein AK830_g127 [Neonectria ditissima]|uniref:Probable dipeptidyl-aminopeptidase B n=1 Tax=Neonectria ditissima TaxID=78410 RepID=A0A0P7BY04_9HYPO|nr:hypothetical protein AK830_g127 [Neonectria ditissima]
METKYIKSAAVSAHWLPSGTSFWYQRHSVSGESQFVLVDAEKKTQTPVFNHRQLAEKLTRETGHPVDENALQFAWIEPSSDFSYTRFRYAEKNWQYGPGNSLTERKGDFTQKTNHFLKKEVRSSYSQDPCSVSFLNRTDDAIVVFWIDWDKKPNYYTTIGPGRTKHQDTYVGHVWRLVDKATGKTRAIYSAPDAADDTVFIEAGAEPLSDADSDEDGESESPTPSLDPDQEPRIYVEDFNVWFKPEVDEADVPSPTGSENYGLWLPGHNYDTRLSTDGREDNAYTDSRLFVSLKSQHLIAWQQVPEQEHKVNLVESCPDDQLEPKLHTIQYLKPGDRVKTERPRLFNLETHCEVPTDDTLFKDPYSLQNIGWNESGEEYRFLVNQRGHQHLRVIGIHRDGRVRTIVEEKSDTFVDYTKSYHSLLKGSTEMLWSSERDGYNHLYLVNLESATIQHQVTNGAWNVNAVEFVDEERRQVWFRAYGLWSDQDPCYAHLACANFDGSDLRIITDGNGTHSWTWSPDRRYLIDTWSRVDCPPTSVLRELSSGKILLHLQETNIADLENEGWVAPETFSAPGRDGETPIFGIIVLPADFDETKSYPVLDDVYAGPQDFHTPKTFSTLERQRRWADQGYIVVQIDGMGTNWRGKKFHDVCYKNIHDSGLPDHIAWLKAAAGSRPWMDLSRVGIFGASAGGQSAVAGLLHHGDFFKAAAADSGCHDNRMDKLWWNELWMGYPVDEAYEQSSNATHAAKLEGALMLIVGELDRNVDPASTLQLVHALNKADKEYELLVVPGGGHGCGASGYALRRQERFFQRHLQQ